MATVSIATFFKRKKHWLAYLLVGCFFVLSGFHLHFFSTDGVRGLSNIGIFLNDAVPPDLSVLSLAGVALLETLEIAFLGTLLGAAFALPLAVFASRNIFGLNISAPTRLFLSAIRSLPALLWAVIFVIVVGLGPQAGVFAIASYTVGYLGKLAYEAIEGMPQGPIEAMTAMGANKVQLIWFVVLPQSANAIISQVLFLFEYNVRASSILGFVGAGGIGLYIRGYLKFLEYDKVLTLLIVIFLTVLVLDILSVLLRDRYLERSEK